MPELPEVATIRRDLQKRILGRSITGVKLLRLQVVKDPDDAMFRIIGRFISWSTTNGCSRSRTANW